MAQPDYPLTGAQGLMWAIASDPDHDGDNDSTPEGDTDHDWWSADGRPMRSQAASGLPQIQQHTDPDNKPVPEDDELPVGVAFPVGDNSPSSTFGQQWSTGPDGPQARAASVRREAADMSSQHANLMGHADAMANQLPSHKDDFGSSKQKHRRYLEGWNQTAGLIHGLVGRAPMSKDEYTSRTGRADLHSHYLSAYAQGRTLHGQSNSLYRADSEGQTTASLQRLADAWTQPHQTTDDFTPPFNSARTSPDPWSQNEGGGDFQAGLSAGQADRQAGERPLFADNSSTVSPYVKGYAQGYGSAQAPSGQQDVPRSAGGDSGQGANAQEAQRAFQVARASRTASAQDAWRDARDNLERQHDVTGGRNISGAPGDEKLEGEGTGGRSGATWRVSASFAPDSLMRDPDFRKGYLFASKWRPGQRLAGKGAASFEAGLYAGMTDRPGAQRAWLAAHSAMARRHPELGRRMALSLSFTRKQAAGKGLRVTSHWIQREGGTSTDLITDGPGTSPDPMGSTPLNGPGAPPPMGGLSDPAASGGAPPYQGAPPLPGGPVVPDDVMGQPQQPPQPNGPTVQTYSGMHPENAQLAPAAGNTANNSGYSNHSAYEGDPRGVDKLAAFRRRVEAGLVQMRNTSFLDNVTGMKYDLSGTGMGWGGGNLPDSEEAEATCRKCRLPIDHSGEAWYVSGSGTTADGLSYCPPNPDHTGRFGPHVPAKGRR